MQPGGALLLSGQASGPGMRGLVPQFTEAPRPFPPGPVERLVERAGHLLFWKLTSGSGFLLLRGPAPVQSHSGPRVAPGQHRADLCPLTQVWWPGLLSTPDVIL